MHHKLSPLLLEAHVCPTYLKRIVKREVRGHLRCWRGSLQATEYYPENLSKRFSTFQGGYKMLFKGSLTKSQQVHYRFSWFRGTFPGLLRFFFLLRLKSKQDKTRQDSQTSKAFHWFKTCFYSVKVMEIKFRKALFNTVLIQFKLSGLSNPGQPTSIRTEATSPKPDTQRGMSGAWL